MLLIGSYAARFRGFDRNPKDVDIICKYEEIEPFIKYIKSVGVKPYSVYPVDRGNKLIIKTSGLIYEFEIAWDNRTASELIDLVESDPFTSKYVNTFSYLHLHSVSIPSLDVLFTLKASHRYLKDSPHFIKTMRDYMQFKARGARISDRYMDWFNKREKETYWYKHPKLNQDKQGFFNPNEGVTYVYDHDSIHLAVAHPKPPAYTLFQKDGAEVQCDKEKFFALPHEDKLRSVLEESYVLAIERSQVPFNGRVTADWSFRKALEKVCTSITSGWWREWAYDHYYEVLKSYDINYTTKFWHHVNTGLVKKL